MKKPFGIILLILLSALPLRLSAQPQITASVPDGEPFFFIQISDPQLGFREESGIAEGSRLLQTTVGVIDSLRPAFVIVTGDMVNRAGDPEQLTAYRQLIGEIREDIPVFHLPGNHDIGKYTDARKQAYLETYGYDRFAFCYGGVAFIGIDSCPIRDGHAEAESEQYSWLRDRLEEMAACRMKFLFLHCPIVLKERSEAETYSNFPMPTRERYIALLKKYDVDAVFAGHLHNTAYANVEGIRMITCGPSGKPLGTGFSGMNIVTVYPDRFEATYVATTAAVEVGNGLASRIANVCNSVGSE